MMDDSGLFSVNQAITVSAASNYPGCGFGVAGAGVYDTGGIGSIDAAVKKFILTVSVGIPFAGPVAATLLCYLQDSPDNLVWATTDLSDVVQNTLATLQITGQVLLKGPVPNYGGGTNPPVRLNRYLRMFYTVAGGPFTAGTINASLDMY